MYYGFFGKHRFNFTERQEQEKSFSSLISDARCKPLFEFLIVVQVFGYFTVNEQTLF
jgi:hypothetical protein